MFTILCDAAPAAAQPAEGGFLGGGMGSLLMIVAIFVVFYFFMIRPQQKRQKEVQKMRDALGKGDKIVVFKYKPKKNERKKQGHRQPWTEIKIVSIKM